MVFALKFMTYSLRRHMAIAAYGLWTFLVTFFDNLAMAAITILSTLDKNVLIADASNLWFQPVYSLEYCPIVMQTSKH